MNYNAKNSSNKKQFCMTYLEDLQYSYQNGWCNATHYVWQIIEIKRQNGWWFKLDVAEFCLEYGISRASLYRALKNLKESSYVNLEWNTTQVKLRIPKRHLTDARQVPDVNISEERQASTPMRIEVAGMRQEDTPMRYNVSGVRNETFETTTQQATQESLIPLTDNLCYTESFTHPPTYNAQAAASPLPHPLGGGEEEDEDFWDLDKEEEEVDYFPSTDDSYVMPEEFQPILEESGYSTVRELLTYQIYWFTDTVHLKTDEKLAMNFDFQETWETIAPRINKYIHAGARFHDYAWWWINEFCENDDYSCEIGRHFIRQFKDLSELLESRIGVIILCDCLHHFDELARNASNVA
ncbi:MAG: hypothetical protein WBF90_33800 [Rivularia sp. (in: cyanobacteria)]